MVEQLPIPRCARLILSIHIRALSFLDIFSLGERWLGFRMYIRRRLKSGEFSVGPQVLHSSQGWSRFRRRSKWMGPSDFRIRRIGFPSPTVGIPPPPKKRGQTRIFRMVDWTRVAKKKRVFSRSSLSCLRREALFCFLHKAPRPTWGKPARPGGLRTREQREAVGTRNRFATPSEIQPLGSSGRTGQALGPLLACLFFLSGFPSFQGKPNRTLAHFGGFDSWFKTPI